MNKSTGNFFYKKNLKTTPSSAEKSSSFTRVATTPSMENVRSCTDKSSQNLSKSQFTTKVSTTAIKDFFKTAKPGAAT